MAIRSFSVLSAIHSFNRFAAMPMGLLMLAVASMSLGGHEFGGAAMFAFFACLVVAVVALLALLALAALSCISDSGLGGGVNPTVYTVLAMFNSLNGLYADASPALQFSAAALAFVALLSVAEFPVFNRGKLQHA